MVAKKIVLLMAALLLLLPVPAAAAEQGSGVIQGQLVNKTNGGSSVASLDVTLETIQNGSEVDSAAAKTDAEGRFTFKGLATDPQYSYQVTLNFQNADYTSDLLTFGEGETTKSVEVTVYDSTTSNESIGIVMMHMVVYAGEGSLLVKVFSQFVNMSDRTYIGTKEVPALGKAETLRFPLPRGATDLQYSLGLMERYVTTSGDGFADTLPVLPGSREVAYSYRVDYGSGGYTISHKTDYPIMSFNLLVEDKGIEVSSSVLTAQEPLNITGTQFRHYAGSGFAAGETIVARLSSLPETEHQGAILWVVLAMALLAAGFAVFILRRRKLQPITPEGGVEKTREKLLQDIARLDDDFEGGHIPEETHRKLRAGKKAELIALMQAAKGDSEHR